ncbi:MAG: glycine--tRNA ligase subunit beta [bacterium]|nr:glycine--tRNA ligase subunit beta [bacterium]
MCDLFFEIGCEELPPRAVGDLSKQLGDLANEVFKRERILPRMTHFFATPRRLILVARGLPIDQVSDINTVTGPPVSAAYDDEGKLAKAGAGFAKKYGIAEDELIEVETDKGKYLAAEVAEPSRPTMEVLTDVLPELIEKLQYPKTMRWLSDKTSFARPVRWLVPLLDGDVVPMEYGQLKPSAYSRGHRVQGYGPHNLKVFFEDDRLEMEEIERFYREKMSVIVDIGRRRDLVIEQLDEMNLPGDVVVSGTEYLDAAFDYVVNSTEYPRVILGGFNTEYLELPEQVIEGALLGYLNLFPVNDPDGKLGPHFVGVQNGSPKAEENVRSGLQRVTNARLADASYFWEADIKNPLDDMTAKLDGITFVEGLGTLGDKAKRLAKLAPKFAKWAGLNAGEGKALKKAAALCKADLASEMVREKEFTYLQGVMGSLYAKEASESEAVCAAIAEHYKPVGDYELPETTAGRALALLDRADTLSGCFGAGMTPTGSRDPFGLRRAAVGICRILLKDEAGDFATLTLDELLSGTVDRYGAVFPDADPWLNDVTQFVIGRLRQMLLDRDYRPDMVDAVLAVRPLNPRDVHLRLEALHDLYEKEHGEYLDMAIALKRPINVVRHGEEKGVRFGELDEKLFADDVEKKTYKAFRDFKREMGKRLDAAKSKGAGSEKVRNEYSAILRLMADLRPQIDEYFDEVMVMDEDKKLRANRLGFNRLLADTFLAFADFTRLKGEEDYEVE